MRTDTCAAIATAPGRSGLAVVRVSGPGVGAICAALRLPKLEARRATYCGVFHPTDGALVERGVTIRYEGPGSYTGEDMLEIGCHGGAMAPQIVLDAVLAAGARQAEPGEFTRRAFLNGKLDLVQVEATRDLVEARAPAQQQAALFQLDGALSRRIETVRAGLIELQALLTYDIDFPEEDDGPVLPERIDEATARLAESIEDLLRLAPEGELLHEGALTVIAGRPNVGKSSLFNSLLGSERAIVTDIPGTTRDAIEATVSIEGLPFRLVDTAGLRDAAGVVEDIGIQVARRYLDHAQVVIMCVEAGASLADEERAFLDRPGEPGTSGGRPAVVLVRTKADLVRGGEGERDDARGLCVSSLTGDGIPALRTALARTVFPGLEVTAETPILTARRQVRGLRRARSAVAEFERARCEGAAPEIAVTHLADATLALEELLGVMTTEDVLDAVFSGFCVGK
ncbi:MAG: tRNA uridine-5-carboxymethylaminomethyl(34) synthesis GTPase MnmE [Gemmatimonadota bacterium]